jgi:copper chaperone CopZ
MNEIEKQLKELEAAEKALADKKEKLLKEQKEVEARQKKLEELFANSGYDTPKALVEDLIAKYNLRIGGPAAGEKKRTRTRITAELRDLVKKDLSSGLTKVKTAQSRGISYVVVGKIAKGDYDKL